MWQRGNRAVGWRGRKSMGQVGRRSGSGEVGDLGVGR